MLISLSNVKEYIKDNVIEIKNGMIIPPSTKDYLNKKKIKIIYSKNNIEKTRNGCIKERIKNILRKEFKIDDIKIVNQVTKKVEENLKR